VKQLTDLQALLERVKAATGPDRELDRAIDDYFDPMHIGALRPVTASIDAALALVERRLPRWNWIVSDRATCVLRPANGKDENRSWIQWREANARTPPLAILAALLTALIAQQVKEPT
jgi:hypothetical protein